MSNPPIPPPADVVTALPTDRTVFGMQLPIQSQSTIYAQPWDRRPDPTSWPRSPWHARPPASSTSVSATTPSSLTAWLVQ